MIKFLKSYFFLLLFVISLILIPSNVYAMSTGYKNINEKVTINDDKNIIQFSNISFQNRSDTSIFGLNGMIYTKSNYDVTFVATATFYDQNNNLILTSSSNKKILAGNIMLYNQISGYNDIKTGYSVDDVVYYKLDVEIIQYSTQNSTHTQSNTYDYTIDRYNINIDVGENNIFKISERIEVYFNVQKHGIFRKLPLKNEITRLDGSESKNKAQITNIKVNNKFEVYNEGDYKVIKIGDASKTLKGKHIYTIEYSYNIGKDPLKDKDELYFNLLGNEWDTTISNFTFNIKMPKEFDKSKLGFSSGKLGSITNSNINYTVSDNLISGKVKDILDPGEAVTVRLELPEGYFVRAGHKCDLYCVFTIILSLTFVLFVYKKWKKSGKGYEVIETVEFYPPEGYNSAEIAYLHKAYLTNENVVSLLIYLANKGYLKIEETDEYRALSKENKIMKIIKLKEYDGDNDNEREFFNGLFAMSEMLLEKADNIQTEESLKGNKITWEEAKKIAKEDKRTYVSTLELEGGFYSIISNITKNIEKEFKDRIMDPETKGQRIMIVLMAIAIFLLITIKPIMEYAESELIVFALIFPGIGFTLLFSALFVKTKKSEKIILSIFGFLSGVLPWLFLVLPYLLYNKYYLIMYLIGLACIASLIFFFINTRRRNEFGVKILGKILGFKNFLETAEKEQLESFVMKNPEYFYNILPYTYALGVSDKWVNQFESIALQPPNWYISNDGFNFNTFCKSIDSTINTVKTPASSSSSGSSSSGSSSGGGSSGGGSGGGGGGSW